MPDDHLKIEPELADQYLASDEESQLELQLQRNLEEDVARIFDESIYSDLEVVCGKLKVLTHSCILKARTHKFYHKLQTILHVNIGRNTFDEIYSFISDAYTECDIQHQEKEIITYLDNNLNIIETTNKKTKEDLEELEAYSTPKCATPYIEKVFQKAITSSPSTELTKEYYALVPIETNQLEKELIEQDALSNAFQSIIRGQSEDQFNKTQYNKPTSLSLTSSHKSKTVRHSNSCDILNKICLRDNVSPKREQNNLNSITSQDSKTNKTDTLNPLIDSNIVTNINSCDFNSDNGLDPAYSPDSLITDEPSSSSDYLSAAYTCSPGVSSSGHLPQLNVGNNTAKMENIFTLSDSGLENTAMLESINSHKSVTLADVSLSENTLHDLVTDDASISAISVSSPLDEKRSERPAQSSTCIESDFCGNSSNKNMGKETSGTSKEEKQRQNEEIVILESSSLSSEAGSWESVILFNKHWIVPRLAEKEVCEKFLINERQYCLDQKPTLESTEHQSSHNLPLIAKKSSVKSTSCFIDAASLRDENEELIKITTVSNESLGNVNLNTPVPSRPMPCSTNKFTLQLDASPLDCSEGNDNEDSLEQAESKDPDSVQKDLTPTIFEMTPNTEDSLCTNAFETPIDHEYMDNINASDKAPDYTSGKNMPLHSSIFVSGTPNNSITSIKLYESKVMKNISISPNTLGEKKQNDEGDSPPILSGGMSIQDHLPQLGSSRENSPLLKWRSENTPIVSGAYVPQPVQSNVDSDKEKQKIPSSSAWVVDMTTVPNLEETSIVVNKKSEDSSAEKKNIFSMYIDLGDNTTLKDMPTRLSSSINSKKHVANTDNKSASKISKVASKLIDSDCFNSKNQSNNQTLLSFEKYESLCDDPNVSLFEIISISEKKPSLPKVIEKSEREINETRVNNSKQSWLNGANDVSCMISAITEEATDLPSSDLFVRLSDLDKPVQKSDLALTKELKEKNVRMTRSIPDNNWGDHTISATSRSIEVISSFHSENALSLNRLFPHLKNEFSRSMPGSLSTRTIGDAVEQGSDASEVSSMQSSTCRSGFGNSTTDSQTTSLIENCTSRLGQDLLRMFLEEIAPDVIVEVSGKRFKAHKCILSSRCQYFAGILSGGWVESLGNVIVLPPFSYNVVYFALCHIYSGLATIPDSVSIVELATIADMLGLEGLKEAIMFTLKAKYCHHFHKPCSVCIVGVLECFPLSSVYGLDDLYHKCLKWITKHFSKVWPTKAFATLPTDLLDKCYQHHIVNLTVDNFVETIYGCGITAASLQNRWAESVARMCRRLMNAAAHFAAPRLVQLFHVIAGIPVDAPHAAKEALDDCITAAIEWAPPEETCRAYHFLSSLIKDLRNQHYSKPDLISNGSDSIKAANPSNLLYTYAGRWRSQCEGALVRATPRVVTTQAFKDLPSDLRKRLRELGCITYEGDTARLSQSVPVKIRKSRNVYNSENSKRHSFNSSIARSVDIARVRASFVPYCPKPVIPPGSVDRLRSSNNLHDFKIANSAILPKVRTTKAQEQRAKFNKYKNDKSQERLNRMAMSRVQQFENTKPRYLEPKSSSTCKHKKNPIIEPLSESSRNSSPIQVRNLKVNALKVRQGGVEAHTISHDSQASTSRPHTAEPSTDSLSESQTSNKYATYTKSKHPAKGSKESIKSSNCYNDSALSKSLNHNNKMKTKIPVYLKQTPKQKIGECNKGKEVRKCSSVGNSSSVNAISTERKTPGSLMNATKSSSAKIVPKVVRDLAHNRKNQRRQEHVSRLQEDKPPKETPMIQRSGTFLKDEPTFGKRPTDIDTDQ